MKLSINLLPPEIIAQEVKNTRFYKIQFLGVGIILILIFLSSLTLALQILQKQSITLAEAKLIQSEQMVSGFKNTQASLILLKDRLSVINQYMGRPSKQSSLYNLISQLTPSSVAVNDISIDKTGQIILSATVADSQILDDFLAALSNKEDNEDKFELISIESLNRGKDGLYRFSLKIKPKGDKEKQEDQQK